MKKYLIRNLMICGVAMSLGACAAVMTPERVAKLPAPIRAALEPMMARQAAIARKFTSGTKKMLEGYSLVAEAIGLKKEAATLRAEAAALNAGSTLSDTRKALSRTDGLVKEVRNHMAKSKGVTVASKERFIEGVRAKNEAYAIEVALAAEASIEAVRGIQLIAKASPLDKILLTATLDPLFFLARDVPRFLDSERKFEAICQEYAKEQKIVIPKANLETPKLQKLEF
jgi:hypothetical protein